jgi:ribose-phosphate pyrophosphokinase
MSGITSIANKKHLVIASGRAHIELAEKVAAELSTNLLPTTIRDFANGEIYVQYSESVRGSDAFVIQSHTNPINKWIMEQLIMIDALKRASAKSITAVVPFLGYSRQDKKHKGREPISAKLIADLLTKAGADRVMSVDLHSAQIQGFFDIPVDHLWAMPPLVEYIRNNFDRKNMTIVSPDAGRVRLTDIWANRFNSPIAIIHKKHNIDVANEVSVHEIVGEVKNRVCVLVDDMIDTGGTIVKAAEALRENGAKQIIVVTTHPVLSEPAAKRLTNSCISAVIATDTLPVEKSKQFDKLHIVSISGLIAQAIKQVYEDGSVTSLFNGEM